jgi:murein DD-endopeptidase MepM/ murein hydrolase activator NlpD
LVACAAAALSITAATAEAQSEGTAAENPPEGSTPEETTSPTGGSDRTRRLHLRLEDVTPQKTFYKGSKPARFSYELAGSGRHDIVIEVVRKGGKGDVVQRWTEKNAEAGTTLTRTWGGKKKPKRVARSGTYLFRVREQGGALAERSKAKGDRSFGFYDHVFPVRGKHQYGDGIGAARQGHSHQGQDVFARCGAPLVAARAGKVQVKGFQGGGAGHYVVIDGKKSTRDYVYMHLKGKATVGEGDRVRTGQRIGEVGESGNASGCHLHFELWSKPGWYEGGHFLNPTRKLKRWDRWS